MNTKIIYKLLEVIEFSENTNIHMVNGKDYKINKDGELVSQHGDKLPISKKNIDNCEFTIIEQKKSYNFRIYKDEKLIKSFIQHGLIKAEVQTLLRDLYYDCGGKEYKLESILGDYKMPMAYPYGENIEVMAEELIEC